jgi:hypothetical protein
LHQCIYTNTSSNDAENKKTIFVPQTPANYLLISFFQVKVHYFFFFSFFLIEMEKLNKNLLKWESVRAQTFKNDTWCKNNRNITDVNALAKAGLFYYGETDYTQCFACGVSIGSWSVGETPMEEHAKFRPFCPMVLDQPIGNITIDDEKDIPLFTYLPEKLKFNNLKHQLYQDKQPEEVSPTTTTITLPLDEPTEVVFEPLNLQSCESRWKRVRITRRKSMCNLPYCTKQ